MSQLNVVSIQRGCVHDGPGMRTTIFLKGCILKCPWCCNPEAISLENQYFIDNSKCLQEKGISSQLCGDCIRVGGERPLIYCPLGVCKPVSKLYERDELYSEILKDLSLYKKSNGGVTFSGGEPLLHSKQLLPLAKRLNGDVSIYVETTLLVNNEESKKLLGLCDGIIVDLKLQRENQLQHNSHYIETVLNITRWAMTEGKDLVFRMVFVNSVYDDRYLIIQILKKLEVRILELLLCHNLAAKKYEELEILNVDFTPNKENALKFQAFLEENNITCKRQEI